MTILLVVVILTVGLFFGLNLWTKRLTRQGLENVPQLGQNVPVQGGSIHYVEKGDVSNQTIVMIHGPCRTAAAFHLRADGPVGR